MTSSLLMNETRLVADPSEQEGRKPFMRICGKDIRVEGRLVRIARIDGEKYTFPDNAEEMINELRKSQARIDLFTLDRKSTRLNSSHQINTLSLHDALPISNERDKTCRGPERTRGKKTIHENLR